MQGGGSVSLAEMNNLPPEILEEFMSGDFVVKELYNKFNQVSPVHSLEWINALNAVGKKGGGIVGITRSPSALSRWSLSYNLRANISSQTRDMLMCGFDDVFMSNECSSSRMSRDDADENKIVEVLQRFNVFSMDERPQSNVLQNIATKGVVTYDI